MLVLMQVWVEMEELTERRRKKKDKSGRLVRIFVGVDRRQGLGNDSHRHAATQPCPTIQSEFALHGLL